MGLFDRSSSNTQLTENNTQLTDARSYGSQGNEGFGFVGDFGGNIEIAIDQVDSGVVAAAERIGSGALAIAGDNVAAALRANEDVAGDAFAFGRDSLYKTAGIAGDSIAAQNRITEYALQSGERTTRDSIAAQSSVIGDVLKYGRDLTQSTITTLQGAISSAANATRSDASEVLTNITKYGAVALAVVAVAFAFRKGRA